MSAFSESKFAWEPVTPRGVAAFARASLERLLVVHRARQRVEVRCPLQPVADQRQGGRGFGGRRPPGHPFPQEQSQRGRQGHLVAVARLAQRLRRHRADLPRGQVGQPVGEHERLYAELYAVTRPAAGGVVALALGAIENALLDAKAKALGVPCYELLGGKIRDRIRVYWSHCATWRINHPTWFAPPITDLNGAYGVVQRMRNRLQTSVRGRDEVIELIIVALLSDGHVLLEDYPGSGKTTLAKALGDCIIDDRPDDDIVTFRRIQFTPDLLPSDVTGTTIFDPNTNRFFFRPGPIFAHIVLADEINRTSPKVQSAMLEAIDRKSVV